MSPTYCLCTVTFIYIKDWKGTPEPQHNLHLKDVVDADTEDEEDGQTAEHKSDRQNEVGICRYENDASWDQFRWRVSPRFWLMKMRFVSACSELEWLKGLE